VVSKTSDSAEAATLTAEVKRLLAKAEKEGQVVGSHFLAIADRYLALLHKL
jgi:hypothetical protein